MSNKIACQLHENVQKIVFEIVHAYKCDNASKMLRKTIDFSQRLWYNEYKIKEENIESIS